MPDIPNISSVTEALVSLLAEGGFEYALMGGLAVVLHGYDRYTQDVDALVWDLDQRLEEFVDLLQGHGFQIAAPHIRTDARATRILHLSAQDGTAVDVFLGFLPFEHEAIVRAETMTLREGEKAQVVSPEDLIIMKLIASRTRDDYDVVALLDLYPNVDRERIRQIVGEYADILERPDILQKLRDRIG